MPTVKILWSGGKDSTTAVYMHLFAGHKCKIVCYIPYFKDDIPLITKRHFDFINEQARLFSLYGAEIFFVRGISYWDYCLSICKSGKYKGHYKNYPFINCCGFRRDSKIKACQDLDVGYYDYESLGIAYDEFSRHKQLNDKKRSILVDNKFTEQDCLEFCISRNCLSPHYLYNKRDGCALCFNSKSLERRIWYNDYPIVVSLLYKLDFLLFNDKVTFRYPLRNYHKFVDDFVTDYQFTIFDLGCV